MAFWSKKNLIDILKKDLDGRKITSKLEDGVITFSINFESGFVLYPYITVDQDESTLAIKININKVDKFNYNDLNTYNLKSKFFKFVISDTNILYLEYNCVISQDNIGDVVAEVINSLKGLEEILVQF